MGRLFREEIFWAEYSSLLLYVVLWKLSRARKQLQMLYKHTHTYTHTKVKNRFPFSKIVRVSSSITADSKFRKGNFEYPDCSKSVDCCCLREKHWTSSTQTPTPLQGPLDPDGGKIIETGRVIKPKKLPHQYMAGEQNDRGWRRKNCSHGDRDCCHRRCVPAASEAKITNAPIAPFALSPKGCLFSLYERGTEGSTIRRQTPFSQTIARQPTGYFVKRCYLATQVWIQLYLVVASRPSSKYNDNAQIWGIGIPVTKLIHPFVGRGRDRPGIVKQSVSLAIARDKPYFIYSLYQRESERQEQEEQSRPTKTVFITPLRILEKYVLLRVS